MLAAYNAACPAAKLGPRSSELGLLVGSSPGLPAEQDPVQQSVEELFEDLSYEMAPVPCAGQELFRNVMERQFGEPSAGLRVSNTGSAVQTILDSAPYPVLGLEHLPCLQTASCQ